MSTLIIPPNLSSPRDDAIALKQAFKGIRTAMVISIFFFITFYNFS